MHAAHAFATIGDVDDELALLMIQDVASRLEANSSWGESVSWERPATTTPLAEIAPQPHIAHYTPPYLGDAGDEGEA